MAIITCFEGKFNLRGKFFRAFMQTVCAKYYIICIQTAFDTPSAKIFCFFEEKGVYIFEKSCII